MWVSDCMTGAARFIDREETLEQVARMMVESTLCPSAKMTA